MEIKLNLASKPYLNRQRIRFWLLLGCVFFALLLVLNGYYASQCWKQSRLLDDRFVELRAQMPGVQGVTAAYTPETYAEVKSEVALGNEIIAADQFRWTSLLTRFEELLPVDVSIRTIQPDFGMQSVRLSCVALDVSAMTRFVDNLLTSEDLSQAYLQQHGEIKVKVGADMQEQIGFSLIIREAF